MWWSVSGSNSRPRRWTRPCCFAGFVVLLLFGFDGAESWANTSSCLCVSGQRQQSGLWEKKSYSVTRVTCCAQMCVCCKSSLITQTGNQRDGWNVFFLFLFFLFFIWLDTLLLADVAKEACVTKGFRYNRSFAVTFTHPLPSLPPILGWVLSGFSVVCWPLIASLWLNRKYTTPVPCVKLITPTQACVWVCVWVVGCTCARADMNHCAPLRVCCVSGVGEGIKGKPRHRGDLKKER